MDDWFKERILPTIVLAILLGVFTLFITVKSLEQGTLEYRTATTAYRVIKANEKKEITKYILNTRERLIVIETKFKIKEKYENSTRVN